MAIRDKQRHTARHWFRLRNYLSFQMNFLVIMNYARNVLYDIKISILYCLNIFHMYLNISPTVVQNAIRQCTKYLFRKLFYLGHYENITLLNLPCSPAAQLLLVVDIYLSAGNVKCIVVANMKFTSIKFGNRKLSRYQPFTAKCAF